MPHPRALLEQKDWAGILQTADQLQAASQITPAWAAAAYRAGVNQKDDAAAGAWLDRALALAPDNTTLLRDRGLRLQAQGEWEQALNSHERAATLRPDVAAYAAAAGFAAFQLQRYDAATKHYSTAVDLTPDNRSWWLRLARAHVLLGQNHEAVKAYSKALTLGEDSSTRHAHDELLRQIRTGSRAASAAYYDAVFADSPRYALAAADSDYVPVWQQIVTLLREAQARTVLDLGCGPGQFAEYLASQLPQLHYAGIDFSGVAVSAARKRCPQFLFEQRELPLTDFRALPAFDVVVCTEVLEHVEADRDIIAGLPEGTPLIASVPNFDAFGHLRTFKDENAVRQRYGALLDNLQVTACLMGSSSILWLLHGVRNGVALQVDARLTAAQPAITTLAPAIADAILWSDGTRYAEDFLGQFGLPFTTVGQSRHLSEPHVALRHDVDWSIENAYAMAQIEHRLGIRSSYYLLHPDGDLTPHNYFGRIEGDELIIDPALFDWANRLLDLGHEVGLHNDLITLALATHRLPQEFLEQIVEAFAHRGIPLVGHVAHGSRRCRELGYMNYQIFDDLRQVHVAVDYQDSPELFEQFFAPQVERNGHVVPKFNLRMADFGLAYEANFVPWEIYLSDSSARWSMWHGQDMTRFERFTPREQPAAAWAALLGAKAPRSAVQVLVHACHWSVLSHHHPRSHRALCKKVDLCYAERRLQALVQRLASFDNVPLVRASERFALYDQQYSTTPQLYNITSSVAGFVTQVLNGPGAHVRDVLEIGCGQGDFLASVWRETGAQGVALGIDGSLAAILTCAGRYPDMRWIADDLEDALAVHDEYMPTAHGPQRYDLVLDKTGAVFITDYDVARDLFARLARLMRPGALYVYVASRHYYERKLRPDIYDHWPSDWLDLADAQFEPVRCDDDDAPELRGYIKRVWRRKA